MALCEVTVMRAGTLSTAWEPNLATGLSRVTIAGELFSRVERWYWRGVQPGPDLAWREAQADKLRAAMAARGPIGDLP